MPNKLVNHIVETALLETPGVVNYSQQKPIEVKPGIFSPIYVNLKNTLPDYKVRHLIVRKLTELVGDEPDYICGMESGGTYYASAVADLLLKPVILFRKENKHYADHKRLCGPTPKKGSYVAIIDDVFATGLTISDAVDYFRNLGCKVKIFSVFSYGHDKEIGKTLNVDVSSVSNFNNLCEAAEKSGQLTNADVKLLTKHVAGYKYYIAKRPSTLSS